MQPLQGSLVALVTPMLENGGLDFNALEALIEWHIESGTNGIVSVGTTGESATVSVPEHLKIINKTINFVDGRVPVIAGTGGNSTQEAIELTQTAAELGADYALLVTPYYNKPNQEGLFHHFIKIADSAEIPQILYNVPSRTACDLMPETVMRLANHQNIVGIKEALDSSERLSELIKISQSIADQKNFSVFSGDDPTFNSFMANGGDGVISVAANVVPSYISQICSLNLSGQFDEAKELNSILENLYELLFVESNPIPVKWMLNRMKRIQSGIRLPLVPYNESFHEKTINEMIKLKLL
ncbi:4-hydroxy-tetrahydrodipicolinate synthase [Gammaproteobacteria bacterium]|nr:4-hydroxy-tetrahydrodipicolinate synthase [Gammaproteobacteria bacterium]MDC1146841.1 4-hydroxy-tetrahydrodipicolinate synthase [Gammaproteobacteria bacterium]